ncbi:fructose symporter [Aspergillus piperis CBS 112811]|uniref:Fructose symporter n=1 Tax=Aspergillus piperis CBS 112811 TaxID=1448313 RepID=A0A8G1R2K0_9EURO|nr:fructose symporter [Aspergillus piperis CBS 112811]RAH56625.1 fructose symporter [Aspergillus piperis CBS 112811]
MSDNYEEKPDAIGKEFSDELMPEEREHEIEARNLQSNQYLDNEPLYDRIAFAQIPVHMKSPRMLVITLGVFAAFSGMLSGLDQSVISGALPGIRKHFIASGEWASMDDPKLATDISLISSLMPLGAMAGALIMTPLNFYFGRRNSIIISCLWYTLGSGLCAGSRSVGMLFAGRFILGIGIGIEGGCVGIYISECVPPEVRGNLVSVYQLMIAFGEIIGYAAGGVFFDIPSGSWRWMLGSSLLFSTILLVGMAFLPESPRWLASKGKYGRAWRVWKSLRDMADPKSLDEYLAMELSVKHDVDQSANEKWHQRYLEVCRTPRNRRALVYATAMIFFGQMTGINAVMYNMSNLMAKMNFDDRESVLMSMVGGGALFLGTIPAVFTMDKFGRRVWAQNILMFIVGLALVGVGYLYTNNGVDYFNEHKATALGLFFSGLVLYMAFFGAYSCLTWVVPAESFGFSTRSQGMAICSVFLYLWSFIVTYNFEGMQKAMTYTGLTIGFFGGLAALGFFYQLFFMPETKDKTLEEIDELFLMPTSKLVALNTSNLLKPFRRRYRPEQVDNYNP